MHKQEGKQGSYLLGNLFEENGYGQDCDIYKVQQDGQAGSNDSLGDEKNWRNNGGTI